MSVPVLVALYTLLLRCLVCIFTKKMQKVLNTCLKHEMWLGLVFLKLSCPSAADLPFILHLHMGKQTYSLTGIQTSKASG